MSPRQVRALAAWEEAFRQAARIDRKARLATHLRSLGVEGTPTRLLEGTIEFVRMLAGFVAMDGRPLERLLNNQPYDPRMASGMTYAVTFDVFGRAFARVLADTRLRAVDLADLYGVPWTRYQRVGYERLWISRLDGAALSRPEVTRLEKDVSSDLLADYDEDELDIWFEHDAPAGSLLVWVRDRMEVDE